MAQFVFPLRVEMVESRIKISHKKVTSRTRRCGLSDRRFTLKEDIALHSAHLEIPAFIVARSS